MGLYVSEALAHFGRGDTPSHTLPLGVQYIILNNTTTETVSPHQIIYLWSLELSYSVDVNLNYNNAQQTLFSIQISKKSPPWVPPPTPSPFVPNTLLDNINGFPPPLVLQSFTFRARFDINLIFLRTQNLVLVPKFPKSPHHGVGGVPPPTPSLSVVSHTQSLQKRALLTPPPLLPHVRQKLVKF